MPAAILEMRTTSTLEIRAEDNTPIDPATVTPDTLPRRFWARVVNYDILDDYGTMFAPGVFAVALAERMPRLMFGHNGWRDVAAVLGRAVEARDTPTGLDLLFEFDSPEFVPGVRQIAYQLLTGTLDQFSIGFVRTADENGGVRITEARLPEVSVVVEGAVPGTATLSMHRSMFPAPGGPGPTRDAVDGHVDAATAGRIMARFAAGQVDLEQALGEIRAAAGVAAPDIPTDPPAGPTTDDLAAVTAEADAALTAIFGP
jgi:HK97 family phage prohead protease